jgi:hypothetical protein
LKASNLCRPSLVPTELLGEGFVRHRTMWAAFAQQREITQNTNSYLSCFAYPNGVVCLTQPDRYGQPYSLRPSGLSAKVVA